MKYGFNHYTPWGYITYEKPRTRTQYYAQAIVGGFLPPVGAYHNARDSMAYMDDYLKNRGFDYDYVKYPSQTVGYSGTSRSATALSVNIAGLYHFNTRPRYKPDKRHRGDVSYGRV